jgi:hypothetical protein
MIGKGKWLTAKDRNDLPRTPLAVSKADSLGESKMEPRLYPPLLTQDVVGTGSDITEEPALYRRPMSDREWQQVLIVLQGRLSALGAETISPLVRSLRERIQWLDAVMVRYCEATCPSCEDPCCHGLQVFYNRTDLLWLLALDEHFPPGQTRRGPTEPCRYLTQNGCILPRMLRPYVCVWFLCEAQVNLLRDEPALFQRHFVRVLEEMRILRLRLETLYRHHFADEGALSAIHNR